jgi:Tfp pilus assembly protein PilN
VRAINLIPPEEQRGGRGPGRGGALSYLVVGVLVAVLAGVTAFVLTNQQISDRKAEVAQLEQEKSMAEARAESLQAFADFNTMQETRTATVSSLAQSRFDWERVVRELSLILPADVWLIGLEGTVSPAVQLEPSVEVAGRDAVTGPALELIGCTVSQQAVGRFVAAIRDIDGITRVTAAKSELPELSSGGTVETGAAGGEGAIDDCRTRDFIVRFEIVAAFDEVPVPPAAEAITEPSVPAGEEAPPPTQSESQAEVQEGIEEGQEAANLVPGA